MTKLNITFIGLGEVAAVFSAAILQNGAAVSSYDILMDQENGIKTLRKRSQSEDVTFLSLPDAFFNADYILSTVTTRVAETAARSCAEYPSNQVRSL